MTAGYHPYTSPSSGLASPPPRDDSRTTSLPPRSRRGDDRRDDDLRGGYGRDHRESPARYVDDSVSRSPPRPRGRHERDHSPPPRRESGRERDLDRSRSPFS